MKTRLAFTLFALVALNQAIAAGIPGSVPQIPLGSTAGSTPSMGTPAQIEAAHARGEALRKMATGAAGVALIAFDVANTPISPGPDTAILGAGLLAKKVATNVGRSGRIQRMVEIANDPKTPADTRGWISNEMRHIKQKDRTYIRNPKGYELAHSRGREAKKGYSHLESGSTLMPRSLHRFKHKIDHNGLRNKDMGKRQSNR